MRCSQKRLESIRNQHRCGVTAQWFTTSLSIWARTLTEFRAGSKSVTVNAWNFFDGGERQPHSDVPCAKSFLGLQMHCPSNGGSSRITMRTQRISPTVWSPRERSPRRSTETQDVHATQEIFDDVAGETRVASITLRSAQLTLSEVSESVRQRRSTRRRRRGLSRPSWTIRVAPWTSRSIS